MPSPFPGMDPYIEQPNLWSDFHGDLAGEIRARLNQLIQPRYIARLTPYVTYEIIEVARIQGVRPDVGIWQPQPPLGGPITGVATISPAPVESIIPLEVPLRLLSVEIRTTDTQQLITAIEILSPVNKRPGHEAYLDYRRKRRDLLRSSAHFMEIDLLRGGERSPLERPVPRAPYYVVLSRADHRPHVDVWPIQLADKLPVLPIPLLEPDPDVPLDLGAAVAAVYERGAYGVQIDYRDPQYYCIIDTRFALAQHYVDNPQVYVGADLLIYYVEGDPGKSVAPDVLVTFGVPKGNRRNYLVWKEGKAPDVIFEFASERSWRADVNWKKGLYWGLGVREYFLFDPGGQHFKPPLQGFRWTVTGYEPLPSQPGARGDLGLTSEVLGLELWMKPDGGEDMAYILRLYDPATGNWLLTPDQAAEAHHAAQTRAAQAEARAIQAEARAAQEAEARHAAEAELARLRTELAHRSQTEQR